MAARPGDPEETLVTVLASYYQLQKRCDLLSETDRDGVLDRLVGMLEAAEAENRALRQLVSPCMACGPLFETPYLPCGGVDRVRHEQTDPHECPLREEGILGPRDFRCTCCVACALQCLHSI